jgi:hypothetical protein
MKPISSATSDLIDKHRFAQIRSTTLDDHFSRLRCPPTTLQLPPLLPLPTTAIIMSTASTMEAACEDLRSAALALRAKGSPPESASATDPATDSDDTECAGLAAHVICAFDADEKPSKQRRVKRRVERRVEVKLEEEGFSFVKKPRHCSICNSIQHDIRTCKLAGAELPPVDAEEKNMSGARKKRRVEHAQYDRRRHHLGVGELVDLAQDTDDDNLQDDLTSNASSNTHALQHKR